MKLVEDGAVAVGTSFSGENADSPYEDSMTSSQPLPDISVQDAESVLGIPTTNAGLAGTPAAQTASSPSYPSYQGSREWPPDYTPNIESVPPGGADMVMGRPAYPSPHPKDMAGYRPYHPYSAPTRR